MTKRWALWGLFAVLSVAALISSLGTAFQTLPLNPDMAEMALIYQASSTVGEVNNTYVAYAGSLNSLGTALLYSVCAKHYQSKRLVASSG